MGMYAKLMARITESSLMEESIYVRYVFMMLLAVADPKGFAIGTDIALCRRLNMPLTDFLAAIAELMKPDPDSNSKEEEGRRIIVSNIERGYKVVNYEKYRDMRNEEERRNWMRDYMRKYRDEKDLPAPKKARKPRKLCKLQLANAEASAPAFEEANKTLAALSAKSPNSAKLKPEAEWFDELRANPAYKGIDLEREAAKMRAWCSQNRSNPSRRRFINWLNRVDAPVNGTEHPETAGFRTV